MRGPNSRAGTTSDATFHPSTASLRSKNGLGITAVMTPTTAA
jgi:hypothetical protein